MSSQRLSILYPLPAPPLSCGTVKNAKSYAKSGRKDSNLRLPAPKTTRNPNRKACFLRALSRFYPLRQSLQAVLRNALFSRVIAVGASGNPVDYRIEKCEEKRRGQGKPPPLPPGLSRPEGRMSRPGFGQRYPTPSNSRKNARSGTNGPQFGDSRDWTALSHFPPLGLPACPAILTVGHITVSTRGIGAGPRDPIVVHFWPEFAH